MTAQELLDLKSDIVEAREELSKLEGRKEAMLDSLKKEYGIKSIAEAEKRVKKLETQITELDADIKTAADKLEGQLHST